MNRFKIKYCDCKIKWNKYNYKWIISNVWDIIILVIVNILIYVK